MPEFIVYQDAELGILVIGEIDDEKNKTIYLDRGGEGRLKLPNDAQKAADIVCKKKGECNSEEMIKSIKDYLTKSALP